MRILGLVAWVGNDKYGKSIGRVKPLFDSSEGGWRQIPPEEFPSQGLAFWFNAPPEAHADNLVFFRPEENTGQKDEFRVAQAQLADEVLDLRAIGSSDQVRAALLTGIRRQGIPAGRTLLLCKDDVLVGPVRLVGSTGTLSLEKTMNRHRIPYFKLQATDLKELHDGRSMRCIALVPPSQALGYVDWDDDHLVVRRALEFALSQAKYSGEKVVLAQKIIKETADLIAQASDGADLALEQMRLTKARSLVTTLELNTGNARAIVDILRRHPEVVKELEVVAKAEKARARTESEKELTNELVALDELKKEREKVAAELAREQGALLELKANRERDIQEVETAATERIQEVLKRPGALLAEVAILKQVLGGVAGEARGSTPKVFSPRPNIAWSRGQLTITDFTELRKRLGSSLKQNGLPPSLSQPLHAAFSARLVPIIAGPRALQAAEAYARVVAGGRLTLVHASASLVEPGDVFGRVDNSGRRFVPHPAGLIDVIGASRQSNGLRIVVLDGVNRGPTESYLLPILHLVAGKGPAISLFSPVALDEGDPYRPESQIDWPSNLLLCATLVEGPTTLPVAPDVWSDGVLVQTDSGEIAPPSSTVELSEPSEIVPGSELLQLPAVAEDVTSSLFESLPEIRVSQEAAARFARALRRFNSAPASLRMETFKATIVPLIARLESVERRGQLLKQLAAALSVAESAVVEMVDSARGRVA